ncbi:MAG TPA: hypothetical protein VJ749_00015 [Pyrinomonadaceae bacterium]|nr:hypothetical protein [Pyrinomonadaceae bacterium]
MRPKQGAEAYLVFPHPAVIIDPSGASGGVQHGTPNADHLPLPPGLLGPSARIADDPRYSACRGVPPVLPRLLSFLWLVTGLLPRIFFLG